MHLPALLRALAALALALAGATSASAAVPTPAAGGAGADLQPRATPMPAEPSLALARRQALPLTYLASAFSELAHYSGISAVLASLESHDPSFRAALSAAEGEGGRAQSAAFESVVRTLEGDGRFSSALAGIVGSTSAGELISAASSAVAGSGASASATSMESSATSTSTSTSTTSAESNAALPRHEGGGAALWAGAVVVVLAGMGLGAAGLL